MGEGGKWKDWNAKGGERVNGGTGLKIVIDL